MAIKLSKEVCFELKISDQIEFDIHDDIVPTTLIFNFKDNMEQENILLVPNPNMNFNYYIMEYIINKDKEIKQSFSIRMGKHYKMDIHSMPAKGIIKFRFEENNG